MKVKTLIAITVASFSLVTFAEGRAEGRGKGKEADTNGDKKISFEEAKAVHENLTQEMFDKRDTNGDGFLTREDRPKRGEGKRGEGKRGEGKRGEGKRGEHRRGKAKEADTNGDKKISFEEAKAVHENLTQEMFDKRDTNGDGFLTREDRPKRGEGKRGEHRRGKAKEADTNGDKKISFEEAKAVHENLTQEMFDKRDTNGDGFLTREDRPKRGEGKGKGKGPGKRKRRKKSEKESGEDSAE